MQFIINQITRGAFVTSLLYSLLAQASISYKNVDVTRLLTQPHIDITYQTIPNIGEVDSIYPIGKYAIAFSNKLSYSKNTPLRIAIYDGLKWQKATSLGLNPFSPYSTWRSIIGIGVSSQGPLVLVRGEEVQGKPIVKYFDGKQWVAVSFPESAKAYMSKFDLHAFIHKNHIMFVSSMTSRPAEGVIRKVIAHSIYNLTTKQWQPFQLTTLYEDEDNNWGETGTLFFSFSHTPSPQLYIYNDSFYTSVTGTLWRMRLDNTVENITPNNVAVKSQGLFTDGENIVITSTDNEYYLAKHTNPSQWTKVINTPEKLQKQFDQHERLTSNNKTICFPLIEKTPHMDGTDVGISCFDSQSDNPSWSPIRWLADGLTPRYDIADNLANGVLYTRHTGLISNCDDVMTCIGQTHQLGTYDYATQMHEHIELPQASTTAFAHSLPMIISEHEVLICAGQWDPGWYWDNDTPKHWEPELYRYNLQKPEDKWQKINRGDVKLFQCQANNRQINYQVNEPIWFYPYKQRPKETFSVKKQTKQTKSKIKPTWERYIH